MPPQISHPPEPAAPRARSSTLRAEHRPRAIAVLGRSEKNRGERAPRCPHRRTRENSQQIGQFMQEAGVTGEPQVAF
jgi:hypothetical protein